MPADQRTLDVYEAQATEYAARFSATPSPVAKYFAAAFPPRDDRPPRVLDIGAGVGREVAALVRENREGYGVEPSVGLRAIAERDPALVGRIRPGTLPGLDRTALFATAGLVGAEGFDGVLCCAVLQHIPRSSLVDAVLELRGLLCTGGRVLVSIPARHGDIGADGRDGAGRMFNGVTADELQLLFERVGFSCLFTRTDEDAAGRPDVSWATLLFELVAASAGRAIDHLATVIGSKERKVATYKLALLRALTEIAVSQARAVEWRSDGWVAVPVDLVAEKWILYYWPLFDSRRFLPQMAGEKGPDHKLGFSRQLSSLIEHYRKSGGGLSQFAFDEKLRSSAEVEALRESTMSAIRKAIRDGPAYYAGSALAEGRLFRWEGDGARGRILVPGPLWRELSLLGHWVLDSIIMRWAELIQRLSRKSIPVSVALRELVSAPEPKRGQEDARVLYRGWPSLRCVWTGVPLGGRDFAVDHMVPWSMWHNNDLWNLVPSAKQANLAKSDQLPSRALLRARKTLLEDTWAFLDESSPDRFRREAAVQIGSPILPGAHWQEELFAAVTDAIECTRLQRGLEAWEPT